MVGGLLPDAGRGTWGGGLQSGLQWGRWWGTVHPWLRVAAVDWAVGKDARPREALPAAGAPAAHKPNLRPADPTHYHYPGAL